MQKLITWLLEIEHLAHITYKQAAVFYSDNDNTKNFLALITEEEAEHYRVIESAAEHLPSGTNNTPAISIDKATKNKIRYHFEELKSGIEKQTLDKSELIEKIVEIELSEWNDIFLYIVTFLKENTSDFKYPLARIQAHINAIEYYLETVEDRPQVLQKIKELPSIWTENILIVDDEKMITHLIKSLLNRSGNIDIAHDGDEAIKMLDKKFYKLIITDINMPIMDGFSFFENAISKYPSSKNRFLFMTGYLSDEKQDFFNKNQMKYLLKPMDINRLRHEAEKILLLD